MINQLLGGRAFGQPVQDDRDLDARSADMRPAAARVGVYSFTTSELLVHRALLSDTCEAHTPGVSHLQRTWTPAMLRLCTMRKPHSQQRVSRVSVVVACLQEVYPIIADKVHETVFLR